MIKFLKAKFIIPALLVILIGVVLMLYFVGALKASATSFDNNTLATTEQMSMQKGSTETHNYNSSLSNTYIYLF